ncbi:F-box protein SKIP2-like [Aphidius gifuensis]|uniref:F-box protein SKIP2-like n=1 Tax=Aphidius gifuensis TaxID=684658 RepID=UPI001CDCF2B4|nr:F-box protein SKIP2-like [Aphidius gifuensis]
MNQLKRLRKSGSKKSLVKKYNVSSQIITRSLSKKNKIYSHHDDVDDNDLYAKDLMIFERVNDDCLAEIFMHVPVCERPKIALVCKKWKRIFDGSWFNVKKLELTHWEYDEYPHFLKRKYPRINEQFKFLKSLLYKCGRYLRELDMSAYGHCNIVLVINKHCPNLVKLRIRINNIDNAILDNAFSHLSKLKVLKIIFHGCFHELHPPVPKTLINSLLNVADTLTDLNISNWPAVLLETARFPEEMTSVISQLKALRKFGIAGIDCPKSLCNYLKNSKTIKSNSDHACYIKIKIDVRESIERIEELDILGLQISDDGIYAIANTMKQLHTLAVSCLLLTDTAIVTCSKMNNLKFLHLDGFNNVTDSSIKLLKNLTHLKLPFSNKITDESAIKVLENSPDMFFYCVRETDITYKFIEKAAEISRNRENELIVLTTLDPDLSNTQLKNEYLTVHYVKNLVQKNEN